MRVTALTSYKYSYRTGRCRDSGVWQGHSTQLFSSLNRNAFFLHVIGRRKDPCQVGHSISYEDLSRFPRPYLLCLS